MSHWALAASVRQLRSRLAAQSASTDSDEQLLHAFLANREDNDGYPPGETPLSPSPAGTRPEPKEQRPSYGPAKPSSA
jgi:hypothetical protein